MLETGRAVSWNERALWWSWLRLLPHHCATLRPRP